MWDGIVPSQIQRFLIAHAESRRQKNAILPQTPACHEPAVDTMSVPHPVSYWQQLYGCRKGTEGFLVDSNEAARRIVGIVDGGRQRHLMM